MDAYVTTRSADAEKRMYKPRKNAHDLLPSKPAGIVNMTIWFWTVASRTVRQ